MEWSPRLTRCILFIAALFILTNPPDAGAATLAAGASHTCAIGDTTAELRC